MTPERMCKLVARWVRFYTQDLPTPIAQRRIDEIDADLHDHITHERAHGTSDRRIALSIVSRMVRGLAADASWRGRHAKPTTGLPSTPGEATNTSKITYRATVRVALAAASILLLPLVAMQITDEVVWGVGDFASAGALLVGTGLMFEVVARRAVNIAYRAAVGTALAAVLLLVWIILAVGVIGDRADSMYIGVLAVATAGATIARLRPDGMARVLVATAFAQASVAVIALIAGKHHAPGKSASEILGVNGIFIALFVGSALLFWHAARKQAPAGVAPEG